MHLPKLKNQLAERILSEAAIQRMLALVGLQRQHAMLRLMYGAGLRVTEVSTLQWAGLPPEVSPHWLRHAHASHALDRGVPISLVQATLGHASVATTGKYLINGTGLNLRQVEDAIGRALTQHDRRLIRHLEHLR